MGTLNVCLVCCSVFQCIVVCCNAPHFGHLWHVWVNSPHCNKLQYTETHYNILRCGCARIQSALQIRALFCHRDIMICIHISTLQHIFTYCNILQHVRKYICIRTWEGTCTFILAVLPMGGNVATHALQRVAVCGRAPPQTVTHSNALHHIATNCIMLQHAATYCNTLQRTATFTSALPMGKSWWSSRAVVSKDALSNTHAHTHSLSVSHSLSLSFSVSFCLTLSLSLSPSLSLSLSLSRSLSLSLTLSHTLSRCLTFSLCLSLFHTHTLSLFAHMKWRLLLLLLVKEIM